MYITINKGVRYGTVIRRKEIVKSYGEGREKQLVLDHVSLEMERGGFVSVMEPSGSGKSTLLYTLSGMDSDYSGTVVFVRQHHVRS